MDRQSASFFSPRQGEHGLPLIDCDGITVKRHACFRLTFNFSSRSFRSQGNSIRPQPQSLVGITIELTVAYS